MVSCHRSSNCPQGTTGRCPGAATRLDAPGVACTSPLPSAPPRSSVATLLPRLPSAHSPLCSVAPLPVLARCFGLDRWDGERRSHAEVAAELQQPIEYVTRTEVRALRKLRGRRGLSDLLEARGLMR
jgi:hypothetical protein